jgi:tetratricopeptide (TPR) repeat protein
MKAVLLVTALILTTGSAMAVFEVTYDDLLVLKQLTESYYDTELEENPTPELWLEKAGFHMNEGAYDKAVTAYDGALEMKPYDENPDMLYTVNKKGLALICLSKYDEVIDQLGEVLDTASDEPLPVELGPGAYIHNTLGVARYHKGEYAEAFYHFNVAHNYIADEVRSLVAYNCAAAFAKQGNAEMMLPYIEEFCRLAPSSVAAGRIFEGGKPVPANINLAERAMKDEAFREYWEDPAFLEIVDN